MRKILLFLLLLIGLGPATAAPLVDADASPEAREAVATLVHRGILKGYPGGVFKGDRAVSRYELLQALQELERYLDQRHQDAAAKSELQEARQGLKAVGEEMDALQRRTGELEEENRRQESRSDKVRF